MFYFRVKIQDFDGKICNFRSKINIYPIIFIFDYENNFWSKSVTCKRKIKILLEKI